MKQNPLTIPILIVAISVALYMGALSPLSNSLLKARNQLTDSQGRLDTIEMNIRQKESMRERLAVLEAGNATRRTVWLTPLLNSYAMRAKAQLEVLAAEAGLANVEYLEGKMRALPLPKGPIPKRRTARRSVTVRAAADYAAAASFVMRVEKELPQVTLQSFTIKAPKNGMVEKQDFEICLEWPGEGEVIK